ncbi:hepatitis A virus cellular receptor 1-like isoform X2 [Dreissena polymorpha]|uniref:hepatitis A virus cellular receptor 1-like isoform X2 n=1 Tax=Dreissena polymorpha TaxID=45954 RepID=UPI002263D174|nr:hepatitis A virus cellular receptor 1-like isoform X2 [Dreissena polymorpha]
MSEHTLMQKMSRVFRLLTAVFLTCCHVRLVTCDFACLCTYAVETEVHVAKDSSSKIIGYLYEFDCKAIYALATNDNTWTAIDFEKQVGYIQKTTNDLIQNCPGNPDAADIVTSTPATSSPITHQAPTASSPNTPAPTTKPTTSAPITSQPTSQAPTFAPTTSPTPTTPASTTARPSMAVPTTHSTQTQTLTTALPTTAIPSTAVPSTVLLTTYSSTTDPPTTAIPSTAVPTTNMSTNTAPTNALPTTTISFTAVPTTVLSTFTAPTTALPTSTIPSTAVPTTVLLTTNYSTTDLLTTARHYTAVPITVLPTLTAPTTALPTKIIPSTAPPITTIPTYKCPLNVVTHGGHVTVHGDSCFEIVAQPMTWNDAERHCNANGGHLAYITSQAEEDFIMNFGYKSGFKHPVWIGLSDQGKEEHWSWTSGYPFTWSNWFQFRYHYQTHYWENCVALVPDIHLTYGTHTYGKWDDLQCGLFKSSLCRYDAHPMQPVTTPAHGLGEFWANLAHNLIG